jgi:hypothetical protein
MILLRENRAEFYNIRAVDAYAGGVLVKMRNPKRKSRVRRRSKVTLKAMLARMKGRSPHGEIDIGPPVGREIL